jgi:hypothetical protein
MVILSFTRLLGVHWCARAVGLALSISFNGGDALIAILFARIAQASTWFSKST